MFNSPFDNTKSSLNLDWNGSSFFANSNSLQFQKNKAYDLIIGLKKILNYKKMNIIYDEFNDKWWITFLCLPYIE